MAMLIFPEKRVGIISPPEKKLTRSHLPLDSNKGSEIISFYLKCMYISFILFAIQTLF
jgi:hypothetical protein